MPPDHHHHEHREGERPAMEQLAGKLRGQSRRLTGPRQALLEILRCRHHPMSAKELFALLPNRDCDLATIYRSLHLLESMGMVKRFDFGDKVARFELLAEGDDGHHHHLVCTNCGSIVELADCFMREMERTVSEKHGFADVTHRLEFFGLCPDCQ